MLNPHTIAFVKYPFKIDNDDDDDDDDDIVFIDSGFQILLNMTKKISIMIISPPQQAYLHHIYYLLK